MQFKNYADFARTKGAKDEGPRKRRGEALRERGRSFLNSARAGTEPYLEKAVDYINPKRVALRNALNNELTTKKRQSDLKKKLAVVGGTAGAISLAGLSYTNRDRIRKGIGGLKNRFSNQQLETMSRSTGRKVSNAVGGLRNRLSNQQLETGLNKMKRGLKGRPSKIGGGILGAGLTAAGVLAYLKNKKKKGE